MSIVGSNILAGAAGASGAATGYQIERSLRFNSGDSAYLSRTPSSAGNRRTWTWSGWVKMNPGSISSYNLLWSATISGTGDQDALYLNFDDRLYLIFNNSDPSGATFNVFITNRRFRDPNAFYHLLLSYDATASSNYVKLYVNGIEETSFYTDNRNNAALSNHQSSFNAVGQHRIGKSHSTDYLNAYLADVHFIDGQALAPTDFGEVDSNNVWQPKNYSGSYGTNGFYLKFADNSSNAALGTDSSGNSNTWTVNNLSAAGSAWNQSQTWSSGSYSGTAPSNNYGVTDLFGGVGASGDSFGAGVLWGLYQATGTFTLTNPIPISSGDTLELITYQSGSSGGSITFASSNGSVSPSLTVNSTNVLGSTTVSNPYSTFGSQITGITIAASGGDWTGLAAIILNGKMLVDSTVVDPQAVNIDSLVDTPTNYGDDTGAGGEVRGNYATMNPLDKGTITLSNGNLQIANSASSWQCGLATIGVSSGQWYWEVYLETGSNCMVGIAKRPAPLTNNYFAATTAGFGYNAGDGYKYNSSYSAYGNTWTAGDIIGIAFDADNGTLKYYKNGSVQNSGTAAFTGITDGPYQPAVGVYGSTAHINFGQRAFAYAAPSGYKALCTQNLPEPTIADGSAYIDVALWTGDGQSTKTISGLNFSPDFVWIKDRSIGGWSHGLYDAIRGNAILHSNLSNAETATHPYGYLSAFNSDGFTVAGGSSGMQQVNQNSATYVGWAWDAGANSSKTYTVTVVSDSGNKYRFDGHGTSAVTLDLEEGSTYTFDQSDSSNAGHPLRLSTTADGTHGSGSEYTTGVVTNGTPGSAGAYTKITIAASAPVLYYYCTQHSGMGGQINTNSTAGATVLSSSLNDDLYDQSQTWSNSLTASAGLSGATNAFDADVTNRAVSSQGTNRTLTFAPSSGVSFSSKLEVYCSQGGAVSTPANTANPTASWNGNVINPGSLGWVTVYSGSGTINSSTPLVINTNDANQFATLHGVKLDGKILLDAGVSVTVPSINSVVRANPAAGFSIVTFTYPSSGSFTVSHGLNSVPDLLISKHRNRGSDWLTYHSAVTSNSQYLNLSSTAARATASNVWGTSAPTSTVFGGSVNVGGQSGDQEVVYCFTSVEGYSAFGSYTGNGSTDGPFVYTGFRVAFLMMKTSSAAGNDWYIFDNKREGEYNPSTKPLYPNGTYAEQGDSRPVDLLSNGFKIRYNQFFNASSATIIYMAFASNPFKTARAR